MSYVGIAFFWISYWQFALAWEGFSTQLSENAGAPYFVDRALMLLANFQWTAVDLTLKNTLRFFSWQNPALLPFVFLAWPVIRYGLGISRELAAGILLTLIAMFVLLPYQGHGWGYRYLHGLIGSTALLGGYGWIALSRQVTVIEMGACRTMFAMCGAVALFVQAPLHAKQAHDFSQPYAEVALAITRAPSDVVIVDKSKLFFAVDLVRNDPFLRNHPKVLELTNLTPANIQYLCEHYSIEIFDRDQAIAFGIGISEKENELDDETRAGLRKILSSRKCNIAPLLKVESASHLLN